MDRDRKSTLEMLFLVRGTLEDGHVRDEKAELQRVWLKYHPDMLVAGAAEEIDEKVVAAFEVWKDHAPRT